MVGWACCMGQQFGTVGACQRCQQTPNQGVRDIQIWRDRMDEIGGGGSICDLEIAKSSDDT